jgi:hypothetical protein
MFTQINQVIAKNNSIYLIKPMTHLGMEIWLLLKKDMNGKSECFSFLSKSQAVTQLNVLIKKDNNHLGVYHA